MSDREISMPKPEDFEDFCEFEAKKQVFYYPCGSISSYQGSIEYTEEDNEFFESKKDWVLEDSVGNNGEGDFIPYEQQSLEEIFMKEDYVDSFTVGNLKSEIENEPNIENYSKLIENFRVLQEKFDNLSKKTENCEDVGVNTDENEEILEKLRLKLVFYEKNNFELKSELTAAGKEIQELQKTVKIGKNELEITKDKLNLCETELFRVKMMVEDLADEDGTSKTKRNHENSYMTTYVHIENIKNKLKLRQKFSLNEPKETIKELNLKIKQKSAIIESLECKLNEFFKPNYKLCDEEIHTERPTSTTLFKSDSNERITYKDVLRDLREITNRATMALKNSNLNRRSLNFRDSNISNNPFEPPCSNPKPSFEKYKRNKSHQKL